MNTTASTLNETTHHSVTTPSGHGNVTERVRHWHVQEHESAVLFFIFFSCAIGGEILKL